MGSSSLRLGYVIMYVKDVLTTVNFYERAFGLQSRFIHESHTYAEMETGQTILAFAKEEMVQASLPFRLNRLNNETAGIEIGLVTENVEQQFQKALDAGAIAVLSPNQKPWGQIVSYVKDNNGCLVEICSPVQ